MGLIVFCTIACFWAIKTAPDKAEKKQRNEIFEERYPPYQNGKFIQRLFELPQFWNVLKGDMSLIGPRPPLPREVVLYTPEQMNRLLVKGGLACICQTQGRSDMDFEEWVRTDIEYIKNRSALFDLKLIGKMITAVLLQKGAK